MKVNYGLAQKFRFHFYHAMGEIHNYRMVLMLVEPAAKTQHFCLGYYELLTNTLLHGISTRRILTSAGDECLRQFQPDRVVQLVGKAMRSVSFSGEMIS
jgi:hypothetical protein